MEPETEDPVSALDLPADAPELLEVKEIPLDQITELENIRQTYHGIDGFAESMHLNGQLQPCWVRPSGGEKPYELIFGYRRKRAAELLEWETIRCEVRDVKDGDEMAKVIVENFQRESPSAVAEARAIQTLKDQQDLTNVEVATLLGCDPSQVSHRLSLLKLAVPEPEPTPLIEAPATEDDEETKPAGEERPEPEDEESDPVVTDEDDEIIETMEAAPEPPPRPAFDILAKVESGELSASVAEIATGLDSREDQEKLAQLAIQNSWSVKRAQNWVKSIKENVIDPDEKLAKFGELEMIQMEDVVSLPYLKPRDLCEEEETRVLLYSQLRSYMDREVTDYIEQHFSIPYENLWDYVAGLTDEETSDLSKRMLRRFIASPHRFASLEVKLKDQFGSVEVSPEPSDDDYLGLPGADEDFGEDDDEWFMLPEVE